MENFPFYNNQEDYNDYDSEKDESIEEENPKKRKKNVISELWKKLFTKESEQPKEEQKSFFEAFQALFKITASIEKEEIDQKENHTEIDDNRSGFRFPLASSIDFELTQGGLDTVNEENVDDLAADNQANSHELQEEQQQEELQDSLTEKDIEQSNEYDSVIATETAPNIDHQTNYDDVSFNQDDYGRTVGDEQVFYGVDNEQQNIASSSVDEQIIQDRSEELAKKEQEASVEHRNKAGATLVGTIIADRVKKPKEQNTRTDTKQIENKLRNINKAEEQNANEIEKLRIENKRQGEQLRTKRKIETEQPESRLKEDVTEYSRVIQNKQGLEQPKTSQIAQERLQTTEEIKPQDTLITEPLSGNKVQMKNINSDKPDNIRFKEKESIVSQKPEVQVYDIETRKHLLDERKHEIKDRQMTKIEQSSTRDTNLTKKQYNFLNTNNGPKQHLQRTSQKQLKTLMRPEYKTAVKQGISAGIIVLVSLGFIILVWNFFN